MYLCLPQQLDGESQPIRATGLQLQGDEGQGQHGSSELRQHRRDKRVQSVGKERLPSVFESMVRSEVCVPVRVCGQPDSGTVSV